MVIKERLQSRWLEMEKPDERIFQKAADYCIGKVKENLPTFTYAFPSEAAEGGKYQIRPNILWTTGFWPGMVWIAYMMSKDEAFLKTGKIQTELFKERLAIDHVLGHHDIGFLYSLSAVADYLCTGDEEAKKAGIEAAYRLTRFYREKPGIIQRGGDMANKQDPFTGVFIVDCLMNIPLLFWANRQTGDAFLYEVGSRHAHGSAGSIIKDTGAVVQHGIGNIVTGKIHTDSVPSQGFGGDDAAWGRGQAWAIYGLPLAYAYTGDEMFLEKAKSVIFYFLNRMPSDLIPNWDLIFTDDEDQRDTSASAIAVCGMLELIRYLKDDDPDKRLIENAALNILKSLAENYQTKEGQDTQGLLDAGVYIMKAYRGVDCPTIWGDYYYLSAANTIQCANCPHID